PTPPGPGSILGDRGGTATAHFSAMFGPCSSYVAVANLPELRFGGRIPPVPAGSGRNRMASTSPFARDLDRVPANDQPLSPLGFLERSAAVYPDHVAWIHGDRRCTYAE